MPLPCNPPASSARSPQDGFTASTDRPHCPRHLAYLREIVAIEDGQVLDLGRHQLVPRLEQNFRREDDYFSHTRNAPTLIEKLASLEPTVLACMHGSAWTGDGGALL